MDENKTMKQNAMHIADAFVIIAKANHYMVGFNYRSTLEELEMAKQFLIARQELGHEVDWLEKAIDLIEYEIKGLHFISKR